MLTRRAFTLRIAALTVLVFGCGLLTGVHVAEARPVRASMALSGLEVAHSRYFAAFSQEFGLDAKQQMELRLVLEDRAKRQKDWWNNRFLRDDPQGRAELLGFDRRTEGVIREILRDDQLAKYEARLGKAESGKR